MIPKMGLQQCVVSEGPSRFLTWTPIPQFPHRLKKRQREREKTGFVSFNLFCRCGVFAAFFLGVFLPWVFTGACGSFMSSSICFIYCVLVIEMKS